MPDQNEPEMTVKEKKREKLRLYALGYYEDDNYRWRCSSCRELMQYVFCTCELCQGACEFCASKRRTNS